MGSPNFDALSDSQFRKAPRTAPPRSEPDSATVAATKRVLFGHLHTEDAASAVARRIRTAIGLGVLADGEKLPKEVDLARQLGVTAFALRDALGTLRREGLIVTRVGKNGGSYVEHPPPGESMAGEELVRLSATEIRDLGDWRAALTTYAARLAARRGSEATAERLLACVDEMTASTNAAAARRALGRFHVELSAGAQSMRLTRAELTVHEEFDWLVQVLLQESYYRQAIAQTMRAITTHVQAGDPTAAWYAGEEMVSYVVTELMRARLQMIAARYAKPRGLRRGEASDLGSELRLLFGRTVASLESMGRDVSSAFNRQPTARELNAEVARIVLPSLGHAEDIVHGLGFMAEIGVLAETRYWLEWWQRASDGTFDRDYSHQLDPSRDDFYEYWSKSYMTRPKASGKPSAVGPYIDHGGVDDYLVTVSVPVTSQGSFVGIMAADIRVAGLEQAVSPWLAQAPDVCVLLNDEGRVLLSNSIRYNVGDVLPGDADLDLTDVGCFDWTVGCSNNQTNEHVGRWSEEGVAGD
jgi:DNA-binding FadR family transcriptional regulator